MPHDAATVGIALPAGVTNQRLARVVRVPAIWRYSRTVRTGDRAAVPIRTAFAKANGV